ADPAAPRARARDPRSGPPDPDRAARERHDRALGPESVDGHDALPTHAGSRRPGLLSRALRDLARLLGVQHPALRAKELRGEARDVRRAKALREAPRGSHEPRPRARRASRVTRPRDGLLAEDRRGAGKDRRLRLSMGHARLEPESIDARD